MEVCQYYRDKQEKLIANQAVIKTLDESPAFYKPDNADCLFNNKGTKAESVVEQKHNERKKSNLRMESEEKFSCKQVIC